VISALLVGLALAGEPSADPADGAETTDPSTDPSTDVELPAEAPRTGPVPPLPPAELRRLALGARRSERRGMGVLATWAVANLAVGTAGWALAEDERIRSFHGGNALWNVVNLGLAGSNLLTDRRPPVTFDHADVIARADATDQALLFNSGLDVAYMAAGVALQQLGANRDDRRLQGLGDALILQGGFLLTFDVSLLLVHRRWTRRLLGRGGG